MCYDINKIMNLINGEKIGTLFLSQEKKMHSKEHWIVYNTYGKGTIVIDDGAKSALLERKSSLHIIGFNQATRVKSL